MPTIEALPTGATPLTGSEAFPADAGTTTYEYKTADVAALGELYAALHLGVFTDRIDATASQFNTQGAGDPVTGWFPPTVSAVGGFGNVLQSTGMLTVFTRGALPALAGRVYEVVAEVEQVSVGTGDNPVARIGMKSLLADYSATDATPDVFATATAVLAPGVTLVKARFGSTAPANGQAWADPSTAIWVRPSITINLKSDLSGSAPNSIARVRRFFVRDVTAVVALETRVAALESTGEAVIAPAIAAGVLTLDLSNNQRNFKVTLNQNITSIVFQNVPAGPNEYSWTLRFEGTGTAYSVAWPAAVKQAYGTVPTINTTNGKETRFAMVTEDGGATIKNFKSGEV